MGGGGQGLCFNPSGLKLQAFRDSDPSQLAVGAMRIRQTQLRPQALDDNERGALPRMCSLCHKRSVDSHLCSRYLSRWMLTSVSSFSAFALLLPLRNYPHPCTPPKTFNLCMVIDLSVYSGECDYAKPTDIQEAELDRGRPRATGGRHRIIHAMISWIARRNFAIKAPIYATISDVVVYSPKGSTCTSLELSEKEALEARRAERSVRYGYPPKPSSLSTFPSLMRVRQRWRRRRPPSPRVLKTSRSHICTTHTQKLGKRRSFGDALSKRQYKSVTYVLPSTALTLVWLTTPHSATSSIPPELRRLSVRRHHLRSPRRCPLRPAQLTAAPRRAPIRSIPPSSRTQHRPAPLCPPHRRRRPGSST